MTETPKPKVDYEAHMKNIVVKAQDQGILLRYRIGKYVHSKISEKELFEGVEDENKFSEGLYEIIKKTVVHVKPSDDKEIANQQINSLLRIYAGVDREGLEDLVRKSNKEKRTLETMLKVADNLSEKYASTLSEENYQEMVRDIKAKDDLKGAKEYLKGLAKQTGHEYDAKLMVVPENIVKEIQKILQKPDNLHKLRKLYEEKPKEKKEE